MGKCNSKPCVQKTCGCVVKNLSAHCIIYKGQPLSCTGINEDQTLEEIIEQFDTALCDKIDSISNFLSIVNVGDGSEIFKGSDNLGRKQLRSLTSEDNSVEIEEGEDTIDFSVSTKEITSDDGSVTIVEDSTTIDLSVEQDGLESTGTGNPVYVGQDVNDNYQISTLEDISTSFHTPTYVGYENGNHKFAGINSDSIEITTDEEGNIQLETPPPFVYDGIPRFIVNNLYTGTNEQGTVSRPFKTIEAAISEFVGGGNRDQPEFQGGFIIIQAGDPYDFTGDFSYRDLNIIIEEGANVIHNPGGNVNIMDLDLLDESADVENTVEMRANSLLELEGDGFNNSGVTPTATMSKTIRISGTGRIELTSNYNSGYALLKGNPDNGDFVRNTSSGVFRVDNTSLRSSVNAVIRLGRSITMYFYNTELRINSYNANVIPFEFNGGICEMFRPEIVFAGGTPYLTGFQQEKEEEYESSLRIYRATIQTDPIVEILFNCPTNTGFEPELTVKYTNDRFGKIGTLFQKTGEAWLEVLFDRNSFVSGGIDSAVDLTQGNTISVQNTVDGNVVNSLRSFSSRANASSAGLPTGGMFINTTDDVIDIVI